MRTATRNWTTLTALLLIIFIDSMSYFIIIPVFLRLLGSGFFAANISLALRDIAFGITLALTPLAYLLSAPYIGRWSDLVGRKKMLTICLAIAALGFLTSQLSIAIGSFSVMLLGRLLCGIASSSQPIAWAAITDISMANKKAYYLSFAALAMTAAMMIGPLLGAYLSDYQLTGLFNNQTPFIASLLLVIFNLLLLAVGFKETRQFTHQERVVKPKVCEFLYVILRDRRLSKLLLAFLLYEFAWSLYFQDISLYLLRVFQYSPEQSSHLLSWAGVWMILGLWVIYPVVLRFVMLAKIIKVAFLIFVLTLLICAIGKLPIVQWVMIAPMAIVVGIAYPSLLALMSNQVSLTEQGWVMGLAAAMLALAWMGSSFLMGWLANMAQVLPLYLAGISSISALCMFISWLKSK